MSVAVKWYGFQGSYKVRTWLHKGSYPVQSHPPLPSGAPEMMNMPHGLIHDLLGDPAALEGSTMSVCPAGFPAESMWPKGNARNSIPGSVSVSDIKPGEQGLTKVEWRSSVSSIRDAVRHCKIDGSAEEAAEGVHSDDIDARVSSPAHSSTQQLVEDGISEAGPKDDAGMVSLEDYTRRWNAHLVWVTTGAKTNARPFQSTGHRLLPEFPSARNGPSGNTGW